jgi:adenylate kinase family enzyme
MMLKRVIIIGSPGSGKSTFSKELQVLTGVQLFHMDKLFWKPGWNSITRSELEQKLEEIVCLDSWIIDGNYLNTMDIRLEASDTIIFLDFPLWICLWGIIKRRFMYRESERTDITAGCKEKLDWEFVSYVIKFPFVQRKPIYEKINRAMKNKKVIIFKRRKEVKEFLRALLQTSKLE